MQFLSVLADVVFIFFIISSVVFGLSFSVKLYAINMVKKIIKASDENFENCVDNAKITSINKIVDAHLERYVIYSEKSKRKRKKKSAKINLDSNGAPLEKEDDIKVITLSLIKSISADFEGAGGYLNYSKNEIIEMLKKLCSRLNHIFDSSGVIWLKTIKISSVIHLIDFTRTIGKFKGKTSVIIISKIMALCFFLSSFISPVGASKKILSKFMASNLSSLLVTAIFNVIGKEWAVLCAEKERLRLSQNSGKKVA